MDTPPALDATECAPGNSRSCYTGAVGTSGVGACRVGAQRCGADGRWLVRCEGEVTPAVADTCANAVDDDCDGTVDEGCGECSPGDMRSCYTGPAGTRGVGQCLAGSQRCGDDRRWPAVCAGEVTPRAEVCDGADNDCDGAVDGDAAARACGLASATAACTGGRCAVAACAAGFGDCDGAAGNGCEVDTRASLPHCGRCGSPCGPRPGMTASCLMSACEYLCAAGFADCDAAGGNGCEVDTRTSQAHCGACGSACAEGSVCAAGRCVAPYTVDLRVSYQASIALLNDGTTISWGEVGPPVGLSYPTYAPARRLGVGSSTQLALGNFFACARRVSGEVVCWGRNDSFQCGLPAPVLVEEPVVVPGINDALQIASTRSATCALSPAAITCWGLGSDGELGGRTAVETTGPRVFSTFPLGGSRSIAAGEAHFCVSLAGTVSCWGRNTYGQLGRGTYTAFETARVSAGVGVAVAAGQNHTCSLDTGGGVACWGANGSGQLGNGTSIDRATPSSVAFLPGDIAEIVASGSSTCARARSGVVLCWGEYFGLRPVSLSWVTDATMVRLGSLGTVCVRRLGGAVHCRSYGGLSLAGTGISPASIAPDAPVFGLGAAPSCTGAGCSLPFAMGHDGGCSLLAGGRLACWGSGESGQLGLAVTGGAQALAPVVHGTLSDVVEVTSGDAHRCAVQSSGQVRCWGSNFYGQLGDGTRTATHVPVAPTGLTDGVVVRAGMSFTCALRRGGAVVCWGFNGVGQLGDGSLTQRLTPVAVGYDAPLLDATGLAVGDSHACAVRAGGGVACWGQNTNGQLGDGSTTDRRLPVAVRDLGGAAGALVGVTQVAMSRSHTCAVRGGAVVCWGNNGSGQLGDGTTTHRSTPVAAHAFRDVVEVSAGSGFTCVRHATGAVSCWGGGSSGELGNGSVGRATPAPVLNIADAVGLWSRGSATCARRRDGSVWCWGSGGTYGLPTLARRSQSEVAPIFGLP